MENIRQAIERAKAGLSSPTPRAPESSALPRQRAHSGAGPQNEAHSRIEETEINSAFLMSRRIVSHNGVDQRSRPFDMLRTQVLQAMHLNEWKVLGITSPTPGCGKTVTAINLAFSLARQPDQSVMLADMDLQKPRIADCLGLTLPDRGILDLLEERTSLADAVKTVRAGNQRIAVLPTAATKVSSELMGSRAMGNLLQDLRADYRTVILDLPPILSSDDVIAILPQIDCVLLVAAVGISKASEIEECNRHLRSTQIVRVVLNKASEAASDYYYYSQP